MQFPRTLTRPFLRVLRPHLRPLGIRDETVTFTRSASQPASQRLATAVRAGFRKWFAFCDATPRVFGTGTVGAAAA